MLWMSYTHVENTVQYIYKKSVCDKCKPTYAILDKNSEFYLTEEAI